CSQPVDPGHRIRRDGDGELPLVLAGLDGHALVAGPDLHGPLVEVPRRSDLNARAALRPGGAEISDVGESGGRLNHKDPKDTKKRPRESMRFHDLNFSSCLLCVFCIFVVDLVFTPSTPEWAWGR